MCIGAGCPTSSTPSLFTAFQLLLSATSLSCTSTLRLGPRVSLIWRHCGCSGILAIMSLGTMLRRDRVTASTPARVHVGLCARAHALLMVCVSVSISLYDWILCVHDYPGTLFIFMVGCFSSSQCVWQRNQVLYPCWPQWKLLTTLTAASAAPALHWVLSSTSWPLFYRCLWPKWDG